MAKLNKIIEIVIAVCVSAVLLSTAAGAQGNTSTNTPGNTSTTKGWVQTDSAGHYTYIVNNIRYTGWHYINGYFCHFSEDGIYDKLTKNTLPLDEQRCAKLIGDNNFAGLYVSGDVFNVKAVDINAAKAALLKARPDITEYPVNFELAEYSNSQIDFVRTQINNNWGKFQVQTVGDDVIANRVKVSLAKITPEWLAFLHNVENGGCVVYVQRIGRLEWE